VSLWAPVAEDQVLPVSPACDTKRPVPRGRRRVARAARHLLRPVLLVAVVGALAVALSSAHLDAIERRSLEPGILWSQTVQLFELTAISSLAVVVVAVVLGVALTRREGRALQAVVGGLATIGQAAPPVGLVILAGLILGVGARSAIEALVVYSALPVLRNTVAGIRGLDRSVLEAARAMGMRPWRVLTRVELPLSEPVIVAGIRTAVVLNVGTATLATFINGGGLGTTITTGIAVDRTPVVLAGSVLVAVLALALDWVVAELGALVRPRGLGA
jgi:osmoprotectant transport system permease protein